ncbi:YqgE/AlgH family protein [Cognatishimia sp. F0-27]|uniref:YqgE/AlgH family protein n=1 Tax=Cognatishimia sp. F0-27 TaxID=2816855 RepID=UPI001D0C55B5|nr:YqgE/AlgH family protein [Cognatishimia sp. F0-27]MCC1494218.1 YqgE/AlgH family protein [Cognatishimia sp. F0-27]
MTPQPHSTVEHLTGRMLIAMPGMGDPRFDHSVVFLCDHSEQGAMGVIVNKPSDEVTLPNLLEQLDIPAAPGLADRPVHFGGPVEMGRGFVLHAAEDPPRDSAMQVSDSLHMTGTLDLLEDVARGRGPAKWLMALGYAGWGASQLENELAMNAWLVCDAAPRIIFDLPDAEKWEAALESLGVSALMLSAEGGTA